MPSNLKYCSISLQTDTGEVVLIAIYRPPYNNNNFKANEWQLFLDELANFNSYLLMRDFNAHHTWWGSNLNCSNGNTIVDFFDTDRLFLQNNGSQTHYTLSKDLFKQSCIYLTFTFSNLDPVALWSVNDDVCGSDHYLITITLNLNPSFVSKLDFRYNLKKLNWNNFFLKLFNSHSTFSNISYQNSSVIDRYETFIRFIVSSLEECLPVNRRNSHTLGNTND